MALETMNGVDTIGDYGVLHHRDGELAPALARADGQYPVAVNHDSNVISFRIQNGPIKENGLNGCQLDTLIHAARHMITKLNERFPCDENGAAINSLSMAILHLQERTNNRINRGVEGLSQL